MASAMDVQELLRLLTTGRNKLPMMAAMGRVKVLQAANLRSISEIASSTLITIKSALNDDEKAAKSLLSACKSHLKSSSSSTSTKRGVETDHAPSQPTKRLKSAYELSLNPLTPSEIEASLALPVPSADEERICQSTLYTNRAPLVLAFAVTLLEYTMPEQPLSSRLSLAQAVVSANSRSKARSLGMESSMENGWAEGQPRVRVMGREVPVLKRSGYIWKEVEGSWEDEEDGKERSPQAEGRCPAVRPENPLPTSQSHAATPASQFLPPRSSSSWSASTPITSKQSTFIARCISLPNPTHTSVECAMSNLLKTNPNLQTADHNIYASRALIPGYSAICESSDDDGETGGGANVLQILRARNITNVLLVVSRWYGGIMLGPDRWRIMERCAVEALAGLGRTRGSVNGGGGREPLWGLDLVGEGKGDGTVGGMPVHKPEGARAYLMKSFARLETKVGDRDGDEEGQTGRKKKRSARELEMEKEENVSLLLGALGMLYASWVTHVSAEELDRRAWSWYVSVRPDVEGGVAGWGGKGEVRLKDILDLRRKG